jgi:hypothetical protein
MEHLTFEARATHPPMNSDRIFGSRMEQASAVIAARGMATFQDIRGVQLRVVRGSVWITQSGSVEDVCLGAGESFRITRDGLTIVCAGNASPSVMLMLEPPLSAPAIGERLHKMWRAVLARPSHPAMGTR